jgi:BirA family biotin operon repressor/biotin-[acetyl-CoA-carboxylase] ligase
VPHCETPTPAELQRLAAAGLVRDFEFHHTIGSTNDRAVALACRDRVDCPFLVLAIDQTSGRGRGENAWWSAPGALTFSLIADAAAIGLPEERWPQTALAAGLAVAQAVEQAVPGAPAGLKWPNDVYLSGRKVSGILVEVPAPRTGRLVVGIGVNVNNTFAEAPAAVRETGCCLADVAGAPLAEGALLESILGRLAAALRELAEDDRSLRETWRTRCLLTGRRVEAESGGRRHRGVCEGIDERGRLIVETSQGALALAAGTVVSWQ